MNSMRCLVKLHNLLYLILIMKVVMIPMKTVKLAISGRYGDTDELSANADDRLS